MTVPLPPSACTFFFSNYYLSLIVLYHLLKPLFYSYCLIYTHKQTHTAPLYIIRFIFIFSANKPCLHCHHVYFLADLLFSFLFILCMSKVKNGFHFFLHTMTVLLLLGRIHNGTFEVLCVLRTLLFL